MGAVEVAKATGIKQLANEAVTSFNDAFVATALVGGIIMIIISIVVYLLIPKSLDKVRISVKGHITVLLRYNVLTTKTYPGGLYMTQVHFTLKSEEIQSIIEYSVKDDVSKNILTTVFNQLMENQRTEYIQAKEYERTENRQSQRNGYYERSFTTRVAR